VRDLSGVGLGLDPTARVLTTTSSQTPCDTACFDFFRRRTAPVAGAFFPSDFWTRHILQVAHTEPAVWSAVAALGAIHRRSEIELEMVGRTVVVSSSAPGFDADAMTPESTDSQNEGSAVQNRGERWAQLDEQATESYGLAMRQAGKIHDPSTALVLSLALAAAANLGGMWLDARVHMDSGQRLLQHMQATAALAGRSIADLDLDAAADGLARMDLQSLTFSESSAPHNFDKMAEFSDASGRQIVTSLNEAANRLLELSRRMLFISGQRHVAMCLGPEPTKEAARIIADTEEWERELAVLLQGLNDAQLKRHEMTLLTLKLWHASLHTVTVAGLATWQGLWDDPPMIALCERIVAVAAALMGCSQPLVSAVVTLDPGLVAPLFLVVSRCRHPVLRRRALALLWRAKRHEGMWRSNWAAAVGERIIIAEEDGLGIEIPLRVFVQASDMASWGDDVLKEGRSTDWLLARDKWETRTSWEGMPRVPDLHRVFDTNPRVDVQTGRFDLVIVFADPSNEGAYTTVDEVIMFG
jgi:cholestenol delta-isomerase